MIQDTVDDQHNAKIRGTTIFRLVCLQAFLATPNTYFQFVVSRDMDSTTTGMLGFLWGSSRQAQPLCRSLLSACLSKKDLGSPLGFYCFFSLLGSGYPEMQPSPRVFPPPHFSPAP